ncbi:MAG: DNA-binding YbaB/EbfC family protein [Pseudoalteromonas tetraodonis]|jgi:DNA-binding YbaB/EbfC family protein
MNIAKMMQQAQQMQADMAAAQAKLASEEVEASVGGGKVVVRASCAGEVLSLKIDPSVVDPEDVEMLEDLVLAGVQQALKDGKAKSEVAMGEVAGGLEGLGIPGVG